METCGIDVFISINVGKTDHWATALARNGKKLFDKALPNDHAQPPDLYERLSKNENVLVIVTNPPPSLLLA